MNTKTNEYYDSTHECEFGYVGHDYFLKTTVDAAIADGRDSSRVMIGCSDCHMTGFTTMASIAASDVVALEDSEATTGLARGIGGFFATMSEFDK
ncbi:MAG: hypothetical protein CVT67_02970 [Actinobacteria bacterium HGW-Actinobacteria-7]|jgi:hypothetical protein|nr:MAG: hypothetical protein CVT67_02970 [Actinobacteria bacterium HGW-Actinobacteria-7]